MCLVTAMCQPWCPAMAPWAAPAGTSGLEPVPAQGCALSLVKENALDQAFCNENKKKNRNYESVLTSKEGAAVESWALFPGDKGQDRRTQPPAMPGEV